MSGNEGANATPPRKRYPARVNLPDQSPDTSNATDEVRGNQPNAVTLADVASHAGVSLATASRVLNGSSRVVNPKLSARVMKSAAELGYTPNTQAQAMARGSSTTVAVIVGDITDPYFSAMASGIVDEAAKHRLTVTLSVAQPTTDSVIATIRALKGQRPQALIMTATGRVDPAAEAELIAELHTVERLGCRVSLVGSSHAPEQRRAFQRVAIRNRESAERLAAALVDRGYRDFWVLGGDLGLVTPSERVAGFVAGVASHAPDAPKPQVLTSEFSRNGAVGALRAALIAGGRPDCVFAVTDVMAVGAMATLREFGLRPGSDVGVAGFDDIQTLQDVTPSLTTVTLPLAKIGAKALELALAADGTIAHAEPIDGTVVLRDSAPPR
jgi:LacI family transcriptional regulator